MNLDPVKGAEIKKTRPVVVVSSDAVGKLPLRLVAPVTGWKPAFDKNSWHIKVKPSTANGLSKDSVVDAVQLRGVDLVRFSRRLGRLPATMMEEIAAAIAIVVEYQ